MARAARAPPATRNVPVVQSRHVESACPANSSRPRRPKRRSIFWPRPSPAPDHSSVPRTPKLRSAFAMNSSNCRCHAAPSPVGEAVELRDVRLERGVEEHRAPVRERRRGREVRVDVLEPAPVELVAELGVGGGAGEERVPRAQHLVREARQRVVGLGVDRAAEPVRALEDADAPAVPGEQRRGGQRVDARADEHRVERRHAATLPRSSAA